MMLRKSFPGKFPRQIRFSLLGVVVAVLFVMAVQVTVPLFMRMVRPPDGNGTLDSVDIWVAPDPSQSIVYVTDKSRDCLELHNPVDNTFIGRLGSSGSGPGELDRPNGVAVAYRVPTTQGTKDVVFVVERDNKRVSAFSIPDHTFIGYFGQGDLKKPYGIAVSRAGGQLRAWITDVRSGDDRVYVYTISSGGDGITGTLDFYFDVPATLESIVIDSTNQRALICKEGSDSKVLVYDLNGNYLQSFGSGLFVDDAEGIALYRLGNGAGYIIVSDQNASPTEFEVFDRQTFQHLGHFTGETHGTDGIALCQYVLPNLPNGSFYAVHSDRTVDVYDWADIASAMNLSIHLFNGTPTGMASPPTAIPQTPELLTNYPNPFNPATRIRYRIQQPGQVRLEVVNVRGQRIRTLVQGFQGTGTYQVMWDGTNQQGHAVASGVYFLQLIQQKNVARHKMLLTR